MKYGISSLFGPGLVGALLLGSGCVIVTEDGQDGPAGQSPRIVMDIDMPNGGSCTVVSGGQVQACESSMAANSQAVVDVVVDWGNHAPGTIDIDDDCRGTLQFVSRDVRVFQATWLSPAEQGSCQVTARTRSGDGLRTELSVMVRVEGDGPELGYPRLSVKLSHGNGTCILPVGQSAVTCSAPVQAGDVMQASVQVDWGDLVESQISVSPTCGGEFVDPVDEGGAFTTAWLAPLIDNDDCAVLVEAVSQEGAIASGKLSFAIGEGQPPGEVYAYLYLEHPEGQCHLYSGAFSTECAPVGAGVRALVYVEVDWGNYEAGSITVDDTCNGSFSTTFSSSTNQQLDWDVPDASTCTVQVEAITADGKSHTFEMLVPVI